MRLSVERLSAVLRTVPVTIGTDDGPVTLNVTYRLSAMNMHLSEWLRAHGDDRNSLLGWLERILARWDLEDADGSEVPTTSEAMERHGLSTPLLRYIKDCCYEDAEPFNLKKDSASAYLELPNLNRGTES